MFSGIDVARTGAGFAKYWMDTIAHNVANATAVRSGDEAGRSEAWSSFQTIAAGLLDED